MKNEEFVRFHCDQEDQVEDFKRLKKMIQENGLPTIEQMISLQRQARSYLDVIVENVDSEQVLQIRITNQNNTKNRPSEVEKYSRRGYSCNKKR